MRHLSGCEVIIHAAGRAHVMRDLERDPLSEFRRVNTKGTIDLAIQASALGVKRFIFLSSIKVNGEVTEEGYPYDVFSKEAPVDDYGVSKFEAELGLKEIGKKSGMEICIIRPALVYGEGVKGNFRSLIHLVRSRLPLPFGSVNNKRSIVSIDNLVDLISICVTHKNAADETFLVSDDNDISTTQLIKYIAESRGIKIWLFPVPTNILMLISKLVHLEPQFQRLTGNLQVDISHTKKQLNWIPSLNIQETLLGMNNSTSA
jgi:nucleoside-diphosphate-sugar epimerase